ncbi:MAG TPA: FAD binding domain-containing protein [Victivallales bacterium]|nr:FAD binding domain-containing protein [Victivallales bacterium]
MIRCIVNNQYVESELHPATASIDFIREELKLKGTKEGCKEGECGACTVLVGELGESGNVEYRACASCLLPLGEINNKHLVTVEGVNFEKLNSVQSAIIENNASQCGFCTPGIVLALTGYCLSSDDFSYEDAINALDGNICRCTGYASIKKAAVAIAALFNNKACNKESRIELLIESGILPEYFLKISDKLKEINKNIKKDSHKDSECTYIAGGTDLLVQKPEALLSENVCFLSDRKEFNEIKLDEDVLSIGGGVTTEQLRKSPLFNKYFPSTSEDLLLISSNIMRNKATAAGNIVNASPIGDLTIIFLALDASLVIENSNSPRTVKLSEFYKGYKTYDLKKGELIKKIIIPLPGKNTYFNFEKVSNRKYLDIASCNSAVKVELNDNKVNSIVISAGGVAPVPYLLRKTSEYLSDKKITGEIIRAAGNIVASEVTPIDDIRGTAKYKKLLLKQLFYSHFIKLFPEHVKFEEVSK